MSVIIRAAVVLQPGCKLYYDCPLKGGSWEADKFFDKYRRKYATFVGYHEKLIDVLDFQGRVPGRYIDLDGVNVRFDGEEKVHDGINIVHFIVADNDPDHARLADSAKDTQRVGDLPHPILFYPGDIVRFKKKPFEHLSDDPRDVQQVFLGKPFTMTDVPRYQVMETEAEAEARLKKFHEENEKRSEGDRLVLMSPLHERKGWNTPGEDLELVARGNVWALYNDPTKLSFESDEAESAFWARDGITHRVSGSDADEHGMMTSTMSSVFGRSLEDAWKFFTSGEADVVNTCDLRNRPDEPTRYVMRRLHDCWVQHRERVRDLTQRLWEHQVKQSAA